MCCTKLIASFIISLTLIGCCWNPNHKGYTISTTRSESTTSKQLTIVNSSVNTITHKTSNDLKENVDRSTQLDTTIATLQLKIKEQLDKKEYDISSLQTTLDLANTAKEQSDTQVKELKITFDSFEKEMIKKVEELQQSAVILKSESESYRTELNETKIAYTNLTIENAGLKKDLENEKTAKGKWRWLFFTVIGLLAAYLTLKLCIPTLMRGFIK